MSQIDKKCVKICEAINKIPGVETTSSCCGHGKDPVRVWLDIKHPSGLMVLTRAIDNRYGGPPRIKGHQWSIRVECVDVLPGYVYCLESSDRGLNAYKWADKIADNIEHTLARDDVRKMFGVGPADCLKIWEERKP